MISKQKGDFVMNIFNEMLRYSVGNNVYHLMTPHERLNVIIAAGTIFVAGFLLIYELFVGFNTKKPQLKSRNIIKEAHFGLVVALLIIMGMFAIGGDNSIPKPVGQPQTVQFKMGLDTAQHYQTTDGSKTTLVKRYLLEPLGTHMNKPVLYHTEYWAGHVYITKDYK